MPVLSHHLTVGKNSMPYAAKKAFTFITILFPQLNKRLRIECILRNDTRPGELIHDGVSLRFHRFQHMHGTVTIHRCSGLLSIGEQERGNRVD